MTPFKSMFIHILKDQFVVVGNVVKKHHYIVGEQSSIYSPPIAQTFKDLGTYHALSITCLEVLLLMKL